MKRADGGERASAAAAAAGRRRLLRGRCSGLAGGGCWNATVCAGIAWCARSRRRGDVAGGVLDAERDADQQRQRGGLRRDRQERVDLGRGAFEHVGAPEVKRHGRELERQADRDHQPAERQHHQRAAALAAGDHRGDIHRREPRGDRRQVGRAQQAGQQADAVEHDARRARRRTRRT